MKKATISKSMYKNSLFLVSLVSQSGVLERQCFGTFINGEVGVVCFNLKLTLTRQDASTYQKS